MFNNFSDLLRFLKPDALDLPENRGKQPTTTAQGLNGVLPAYLGGGSTTPGASPQMSALTQPMPGQLDAIASQLSAGYGQPASSYLSMFKNIYK